MPLRTRWSMLAEPVSTISSSTAGYFCIKMGRMVGSTAIERRVEMPTRSLPLVSWRMSIISRRRSVSSATNLRAVSMYFSPA